MQIVIDLQSFLIGVSMGGLVLFFLGMYVNWKDREDKP